MATTVGQHSVAAFTSPVNGTTPIDANTVRGNDNTVRVAYVDHDADPGIHVQSSTLASRPTAGTAGRKWITEDSGVYTLWFDDGTNWHPVSSENVALTVLAGENLVKGDVVKVTGWNNGQDLPEVVKTTSASDTAFAVITAAVSSGSMGYATNTGIVQDVNTAAYSVGTILYANGSGGFTSTKPTSGHYQPCAYVLRSNTNNGVYYVEFSSPRIVESSANTASTIVQRDASGNFSAGTITAGALTSTGLVTFASLKGTGATTVTDILNDSTMATASATTLATSSSIKTYVDNKVATVDTLAEVLANGNTTGANDIIVNAGQKIRTPLVAAQDGTSAITIANSTGALTLNTALADSNLATISTAGKVANSATTATSANTASAIVARDASGNFTAGTITATLNGAAPAGSLSGSTLASGVTASSLTSVGTLTSLTVSGATTASGGATISGGSFAQGRIYSTSAEGFAIGARTGSSYDFILYNPAGSFTGGIINVPTGTGTVNIPNGNLAVDTNTLYVDAANNRVGIGTASPSSEFHVKGVGEIVRIETTGTTGNGYIAFFDPSASKGYVGYGASGNENFSVVNEENGAMVFSTNGNNLTLDASGNLGLGVTPSAWLSAYKVLEVQGGSFASSATSNVQMTQNAYLNASTQWIYKNSTYATQYSQASGQHVWYNAASGTAGNTISFTQAMTLDASGRLQLNTTTAYTRVTIKGSAGIGNGYGILGATANTGCYFGAISATADDDFEIWNERTGYLRFGTNNIERARIDASGNLGVGTTSPGSRLHVVGGQDNARFASTTTNMFAGFYYNTSTLFGYIGNGSGLITGGASGDFAVRSEGALLFSAGGATERARITSGGEFLIGTTTATGPKLEVSGTARATGGINTNSGSASVANTTWTTLFTVPQTTAGKGIYSFMANYLDASDGQAFVELLVDRTYVRIASQSDGATLKLRLSGQNVQAYHNYGATVTISWGFLQIQIP